MNFIGIKSLPYYLGNLLTDYGLFFTMITALSFFLYLLKLEAFKGEVGVIYGNIINLVILIKYHIFRNIDFVWFSINHTYLCNVIFV